MIFVRCTASLSYADFVLSNHSPYRTELGGSTEAYGTRLNLVHLT
jgi:hypothetical protein